MKIFNNVTNHLSASEFGEIAIEGQFSIDGEDGITVAWVTPDGEVRMGSHGRIEYLDCDNIQASIAQAQQNQFGQKKKIVEEIIDQVERPEDMYRLLMKIPKQLLVSVISV